MECQPLARVWNKSIPGSCLDLTAFWYANAAASILTDLVILALPMPKIKALQLPIRQKVGLFMVFALGGFVCVTSILRMITLNPASKSTDQTYGTLISTTWTTIEANTGIICANLPVLKAPLSMLFPRLFNSHLSIGESLSLGRRYSRRTPASTSRENSAASRRDQYGDTLTLNPSNTSTERPMTGESTESIVRVESTGPPIRGIKKTTDVKVQFAEADDFNLIHSRLKDNGRLHGPHIV
ncbi:hypothetical protein MMC06_001729 [Schaereria dolodes]|nr:hypothetical protein [Schaereria dolodes]